MVTFVTGAYDFGGQPGTYTASVRHRCLATRLQWGPCRPGVGLERIVNMEIAGKIKRPHLQIRVVRRTVRICDTHTRKEVRDKG